MLPNRIRIRHEFLNAIVNNDNANIMVGLWTIGTNFCGVSSAFGEHSSVTPLMVAIDQGNAKLVNRLLNHKRDPADPNAICEGRALITNQYFDDFLYISPLVRCVQRYHLASPAQKQTFVEIYNDLRDHDADLYAAPPVQYSDLGKTPLQERWESDIEDQMDSNTHNAHAEIEKQYQQHKHNQQLKSKLQNAVDGTCTSPSKRTQKI